MRIDTGQHLRLDQRMKLAPQMIQSMEILQMTAMALEERIEQELTNNPTLELQEPGADDLRKLEDERIQDQRDASEGERELIIKDESVDPSHADDFERLYNLAEAYGENWESNYYESGDRHQRNSNNGDEDKKFDAMANTAARAVSLTDQLLAQWGLVETLPEINKAGQYLIGFIDSDGYLRTDRDTLIDQMPGGVTPQQLDEAIELLQRSLEPVGLGARDLRECFLLQIDARAKLASADHAKGELNDFAIERALVQDHLKDIENNRMPKIAKAMGMTIEQVKDAIVRLRQFHPHPGRLLVDERPRLIRPDAVIEYDEELERYTACLTNDRVPSLRINRQYLKMIREGGAEQATRQFITNNLRSARWLIEAIQQRSSTLLRVINVVVEAQHDYFDHGLQMLKPLPMTLVADQLGIHVATVSRAVNEKYLQTPRGIVPLRMFFSGGTETEDGDAMSWAAIQAKLEQIIGEEDKSKPLSDDDLVEKLKGHGIEIARRTVAKYRKQLNIPTARQRKEY